MENQISKYHQAESLTVHNDENKSDKRKQYFGTVSFATQLS